MHTIKKLNNRLIIQVGETYDFGSAGVYKIVAKTNEIVNAFGEVVALESTICLVENVETGEKRKIGESTLQKELPKYNNVVEV